MLVPFETCSGVTSCQLKSCCRRQEQKQELGEKDIYVGDISQPDTLQEAMKDSDKLVM